MLDFVFVIYFIVCLFFFFKQKTAYEMRISDWSSDVCSSDLIALVGQVSGPQCERPAHIALIACPEVEKHMTFLLEEFGVRAVDIVRTAIGQLGNDKEFTVRARLLTHISTERSGPAWRV